MKEIFCKSFIFNSFRYEEYQDGKCINSGSTNLQISAIAANGIISFKIIGNHNLQIERGFTIGLKYADILEDRIQ